LSPGEKVSELEKQMFIPRNRRNILQLQSEEYLERIREIVESETDTDGNSLNIDFSED